MNTKPTETSAELSSMLEKARSRGMTPAEYDAQRRSFVRGQIMLDHPEMTRAEADAIMAKVMPDLYAAGRLAVLRELAGACPTLVKAGARLSANRVKGKVVVDGFGDVPAAEFKRLAATIFAGETE